MLQHEMLIFIKNITAEFRLQKKNSVHLVPQNIVLNVIMTAGICYDPTVNTFKKNYNLSM